jgi:hypothetical protein
VIDPAGLLCSGEGGAASIEPTVVKRRLRTMPSTNPFALAAFVDFTREAGA